MQNAKVSSGRMKGKLHCRAIQRGIPLYVSRAGSFLTFAFCLLTFAFCLSASPPPDIRSIVPPQPFSVSAGGIWLVAAGACLASVALVIWWWLRRPGKTAAGPVLTPRQVAAKRLQELETTMDTLSARAFGGEVADVLRVYIGAQYGLRPERQTSEEFLASITGSRTFSVVEHTLLRDFLEGCDLLKFARADATLHGKRRLLVQALEFLEGSAPPLPVPTAPGNLTPAV